MTSKTLYPKVISKDTSGDKKYLTLKVPADLQYFEGHFDAGSILPGVVQVKWAVHFGRQLFDFDGKFQRLETLKFQHVIVPDAIIELLLTNQPDSSKLYFTYSLAGKKASSGRIVFGVKGGV